MIFDLDRNEGPEDARYGICILGAGAAGITLARKLSAAGQRVALCEAGDIGFTSASQDVYVGQVDGDPYFDLDLCRLRFFGGSTNHWGGMSRMLDPVDFRRDAHGAEYRWPITHEDLAPHLAEACDIIEVDPRFNDDLLDPETGVTRVDFHFSAPVNFGTKYEAEIATSERIDLFLNANFMDFDAPDGADVAQGAVLSNYRDDIRIVRADRFVLAMGGIETSRMLLWLRERHGARFFDDTTPVGRYWMEHPHFVLGEALVTTQVEQGQFYSLSAAAQEQAGTLNCMLELDRQGDSGTRRMINELLCVAPTLGARALALADRNLVCGVRLRAAWEQAPDSANRVALDVDTRDRFGIPRTVLQWSKGTLDRRTIEAGVERFNTWLQAGDLGRLRLDDWLLDGGAYPDIVPMAGNHHMGGARMGTRRDLSVVDPDSRLHGSPNIYIAGSSVFVTSGHANPTLPLLQLTLRLAEHLTA